MSSNKIPMKKKYRLYFTFWMFGIQLIDAIIVIYSMIKNPEYRLTIAAVGFIIHLLIMLAGIRFIIRRAKLDPMTEQ